MHNPTFKPPRGLPPQRQRSPSPPHAFVEPLSPQKPTPIEPNFNYPAINNHVNFNDHSVTAETAHAVTPRARDHSGTHSRGHHRTSSTIDALAEVALAASPSFKNHPGKASVTFETIGHGHDYASHHAYSTSEPPHKRARSEFLPSPQVAQYASRPATSYEPHAWSHSAQPGQGYNSRVEEAALLLNFQSGGWPSGSTTLPSQPAVPPRPHANSFPRDARHMRPIERILQSPPMPAFKPEDASQSLPNLPSPQQTVEENNVSPGNQYRKDNVEMVESHHYGHPQVTLGRHKIGVPQQTRTPPEELESRVPSAEISLGEASDAPKSRRGWPKGKPRGSGARKTMAEKAANKRAASHKKTPDSKAGKRKSDKAVAPLAENNVRRKSLGDATVFDERECLGDMSQPSKRSVSVPREVPMIVREGSSSKARRKATVDSETICAGCSTSRKSANSRGEMDEWIGCNGCKRWFHIDCAGFKKAHEVRDVDKFFCAGCEPQHGPTTFVRKSSRAHASVDYAELQKGVLKTSEESVEHHYIQPIKDGTFQFDPESFPRMRPEMVTKEFFERSGTFVEPICIPAEWNPRPWTKGTDDSTVAGDTAHTEVDSELLDDLLPEDFEYDAVPDHGQDKLEMVMPEGLTVRQVCNLVGGDYPLDVIEVKTQNSGAKWTLGRWADYYEEQSEEKAIRNVISLEVSQTRFGRLLQRPKVVRDIDLQDDVWPQEELDKGKWPKVQFYCLMSVADSYTDFHIDFGGSSVYYHILKGKKTFFFIPPKTKHLKAYEEWNDSPQQNYTFLPSITKECYRVDLSEGDTMLIPSGWIHAVWTPADSLVVGGNFLNRMAYKNQFKVVEIEKANETPMKFRYPFFQKIMWYTAIKYLKTDPLPPIVSQLFYEGKRFERQQPIWVDFDGEIAAADARSGAQNARYYSQAELDGLPDLVNFIFRTVMVVTGRTEGVTQERIKRVYASIPKGHGEPLEVAKTFALWVAWKRGNEDPPAWAHPDAVLPNSKDEGPPKKLSERKLKELERREAIAACRVAPDRQSARVMTKNAMHAAMAADATTDSVNSSPAMAPQQNHQYTPLDHQNQPYAHQQAARAAPPAAFMMSGLPGQHLRTPKTSVLGPKRVACDACRKRRIRCKHKDVVMPATPSSTGQLDNAAGFQSQLAPELLDHSTNTAIKHGDSPNFLHTTMDEQQPIPFATLNGVPNGETMTNGVPINGQGPFPGTNAYVNANIPMTMNGVPIFGEVPKRGRSRACYECRKSKRRCIHDENGNVDPVKAAETPVPRGSISIKKGQFVEDGGPLLLNRYQNAEGGSPTPQPQSLQKQDDRDPKAEAVSSGPTYQPMMNSSMSAGAQQRHFQSRPKTPADKQPEIDPNLFAMYPDPHEDSAYGHNNYPYPTTERQQPYTTPQQPYQLPSLEQIANEVLVDLTSPEHPDHSAKPNRPFKYEHGAAYESFEAPPMANGQLKPDGNANSAVSIPTTEPVSAIRNPQARPKSGDSSHPTAATNRQPTPSLHSDEPSATRAANQQTLPSRDIQTSPDVRKSVVSDLPLYKPPAPLSQSPEAKKRQPAMSNGTHHGKSSSPESTFQKRKRDSMSTTPGPNGLKKAKVDGVEQRGNRDPSSPQQDEERQSIELARMLQQEDMGLRRRSR